MKTMKWMALSAIACMACACGNKDAKQMEQANVAPKVRVATASSREVAQIVTFSANVESDVKNKISPQANLRIEKIMVEVGDRVRKGQVLVQLDQVNLQQMKLALDNQRVEFGRVDELYKVGGASKSEWDMQKMNLEVRETQYKNSLENTQLKAPTDGVVTARNYDNGDMTGADPVLVIEQDRPVKMLINVSEQYYSLVRKGMPVEVKLDAYGEETFVGTVSIVYPAIDAVSHTFPVEVRVANDDRRVRPGMFARVTMTLDVANHVVVPDEAVVKQVGAGDYYIFVVQPDQTVTYNLVHLGRRFDAEYEILDGVEPGATIVVQGNRNLANGMKVEIIQ